MSQSSVTGGQQFSRMRQSHPLASVQCTTAERNHGPQDRSALAAQRLRSILHVGSWSSCGKRLILWHRCLPAAACRDEVQCRFCLSALPAWKPVLRDSLDKVDPSSALPVVAVVYGGQEYR
jgi:hypothetical protein